jgi:hypothetical protein
MNTSSRAHTDTKPLDITHILSSLRTILPAKATELIASSHDTSHPLEQNFVANPDHPAEHSPRWHQYGILTHSEKFRVFIELEAPILMKEWGLADKGVATLSEKIEGTSKSDLLQIASLLHDLGKFTSRTLELQEDETILARFQGHEAHSGTIIRTAFKPTLEELGLRDAQIEYIAQCTEHHFDLGKARQVAIEGSGYTMTFARSDAFKKVANDIIAACLERALEIGLMFMADSLSKTEVTAVTGSDEAIESQRESLKQLLKTKNLDPRLINQALQQPVNVEIGRRYLEAWASHPAA